jgi:hypothetical protein
MDLTIPAGVSESPRRRVIIGANVVADLEHPHLPQEIRHSLFLCQRWLEAIREIKVFGRI